jgi:hypothetical protein
MSQYQRPPPFERFSGLLNILVAKIQARSLFPPQPILSLSTVGMTPGCFLAQRLGISSQSVLGHRRKRRPRRLAR